jgi:hypothetical protein
LEEVIQTYEQKYGKPEDQTTLLPLPEMKV